MILNYLKITISVFRKNLSRSLINVLCLSLGFTCCLAIGIYVHSELTHDHFHRNKNKIYRVNYDETTAEIQGSRRLATVGPPVGPAMKEIYPMVKDFVRFRDADVHTIRVGDRQFYEDNIFFVDPSVFSVFDFHLIAGNGATALSDINGAVVTREMAMKYFGRENVLGETLTMDNSTEWKIAGVLESIPENSHLKFGVLLPFNAFRVPSGYPVTLQDWGWISFHTYLMLDQNADPRLLEEQFPSLIQQHFGGDRAKKFRYRLQALTDIYMGDVKHAGIVSGNMTYVYSLVCAAILILVAAGFNYINLFTAQSLTRTREIGIRKVSGAKKNSIAFQFILEAALIAALSMIISIMIFGTAYPFLGDWTGLSIPAGPALVQWLSAAILLSFIIGACAGLYPSVLLASLEAGKILKGNFKSNLSGRSLRKVMVVLQFLACTTILSAVLVINDQLAFIKNKYLGFEKDELLLLKVNENELAGKYDVIREELLRNPYVEGVSVGGHRMDGENGNVPMYVEGSDDGIPMNIDAVKHDYFKTTGIRIISGREFDERFHADSAHGVIINESAARVFGWSPTEAPGKKIRVGAIVTEGEIIGVVADYHFGSLHSEIKPLVIYYPRTLLEDVYVRVKKGGSPAAVIGSIETSWSRLVPNYPFDFTFLTDHINRQYQNEEQFSKLFIAFSLVSVIIACLGLYALVSQEVIFRVKEIGIRKVLGATTSGIFRLVAGKFVVQVVVACVIGVPLTWYFLAQWLNGFAYHTEIKESSFLIAAAITVLIAFLTIMNRAISASLANPVDSIKSE